jgi:hypothetical protein
MGIRELAKQAGFEVHDTGNETVLVSDPHGDALVRFEALVRAAERERCAMLCEETGAFEEESDMAFRCAEAIRRA